MTRLAQAQLLVALAAAVAVGCATTPPPRAEIVWPLPPEKPRVRYVTSISKSDDFGVSSTTNFLRVLLGGSSDLSLGKPMGAALSPDGKRLYIADYGRLTVMVIDFDAKVLREFAPGEPLGSPFNLALDADENVYIADQSGAQVLVFSKGGVRLRAFGKAQAIERPTGIAVDSARRVVYVTDTASTSRKPRVLAYDLEGKLLREVGAGVGTGDGQFNFPLYLAVDSSGSLYVADTLNFRVQVFSSDGKFLRKFGDNGDAPGTFARLKGLALDGFSNLYAVDASHDVVQMFNRNFDALMYFGGKANKLEWPSLPSCIAIDPKINRIYVCNEISPRINVYDLINTKADDSYPAAKPNPVQPAAAP